MSSCSATRFTLPYRSPVSSRSCTTMRTARCFSSSEYRRCDPLPRTATFIALILIQRSRASKEPRAIPGVGPIVACYLIGYSGDVRRFPTAGHYARYNATAPIEASSGPKTRHRSNPNGNRRLNHALHIAALGQISHDTPGRAYYLRKQPKARHARKRCAREATHQRRRLPHNCASTPTPEHSGPGRTTRDDS